MKEELKEVRNKMWWYYDKKKIKGLIFKEGDMVYLFTKNIEIKWLLYKLDYKYIRLYKIKWVVKKDIYELDLLPKVRLYLVYYISYLELAADTI